MRFLVKWLLEKADIRVGGDRSWDMQVHNKRVFGEILLRGSLGLGESYMHGWWDCGDLEEFFRRLLSARLDRFGAFNPVAAGRWFQDHFTNLATRERSFETGKAHYDLGNDLFSRMLDERMVYTCAYWSPSAYCTLDQVQFQKLDLVCRKLRLRKGMTVLDIGCGWGSFAKFAAESYGAIVKGITVSDEQAAFARENCKGLPVSILVQDYRDCTGHFDRIASLGMFEHVEPRNYADYFACVDRCLRPDGLFLLHTIGTENDGVMSDPFIRKYVFPQGIVPSRTRTRTAAQDRFSILDWHDFDPSQYARTLCAWHENFARAWPELKEEYGSRLNGEFKRMWQYYLLSCAGAFSANRLHLWQIVMAKTPLADYPFER
jgi:cyclopropane-fatty-acyl-phospholipid synthase